MSATAFEPLLTAEEIAARLGVAVSWVRDRCRERAESPIPCIRFPGSRLVRFKWSEVEEWLARAKAKATPTNYVQELRDRLEQIAAKKASEAQCPLCHAARHDPNAGAVQ